MPPHRTHGRVVRPAASSVGPTPQRPRQVRARTSVPLPPTPGLMSPVANQPSIHYAAGLPHRSSRAFPSLNRCPSRLHRNPRHPAAAGASKKTGTKPAFLLWVHLRTPIEFSKNVRPWSARGRPTAKKLSHEKMLVIAVFGAALVATIGVLAVTVATTTCTGDDLGTAEVQVKNTGDALALLHIKFDRYPTAIEGLRVLTQPRSGHRPLMRSIPVDPWGHRIVYRAPVSCLRFEVYSLGPDGIDGTPDDIGRRHRGLSETDCRWPESN